MVNGYYPLCTEFDHCVLDSIEVITALASIVHFCCCYGKTGAKPMRADDSGSEQ